MIDVTAPPSPYDAIDPNGSADIHDNLQEMINGVANSTPGPRGALYFPPGRYPSAARSSSQIRRGSTSSAPG